MFLGNKSRPHPSLNTETEDQSKKCYTLPEQPGTPTSHETQLPVVQASNVEHATRRGAENTHSSTEHPHDYRKESLAREDPPSRQTLPRESLEEEDGSCPSLSPLSSSPSSPLSLGEDTPNENNRNTCDIAAIQNEMGAHESEAPLMEQLLLHSGLLVAEGALPQDRQALLELKAQTEMELVWIKQAISSRQKDHHYTMSCVGRVTKCHVMFYLVSSAKRPNQDIMI